MGHSVLQFAMMRWHHFAIYKGLVEAHTVYYTPHRIYGLVASGRILFPLTMLTCGSGFGVGVWEQDVRKLL